MKVVIDFGDLEEIYEGTYDGDTLSEEELREIIFNKVIDEIAKNILNGYHYVYSIEDGIRFSINKIISENKEDIISKVIEGSTKKVLNLKKIKEMTPKKKDFKEIDSEWEEYFTQLIDKCIAKKFK